MGPVTDSSDFTAYGPSHLGAVLVLALGIVVLSLLVGARGL